MWLCYKLEDMDRMLNVEVENYVSYFNYRWR